ncbi:MULTISPECIES: lipoprotein [unclassified Streptococcus]|uniref:LptM family lipoprotein n=1 Tax=unclassified Streptococcus TaxID=2608887 RepID=UPI001072E649|nr:MULTISPECIES: hypothetical protein [unclassified Streptococcus]MBF0786941.1 hypothetical protein [Streptococcus sp. 19428wC2_LYSM12]MCQ9211485.1 hypothetical protein [Streptococcus sp. B01]MCQ9214801.1 hypothetical protein [Streptococcus sp. O1]TFV06195.1 hypothetical protein E4T79_03335 [Streptococcus sp. LYSM12]
MNMKKWFGFLTLGLALIMLVACGQKSTEDIVKNDLQNSYTGSAELRAYESFFNSGGDTLSFDKKDSSITNSNGEKVYFKMVSKADLPSSASGALTSLEDEVKNSENFTIAISSKKEKLDTSDAYFQISLSDGGKKIRIIELRRNHFAEGGFYDFSGEAK